jgi:heme exporter protein D
VLWSKWGFRGYIAMFIGIGFLAMSKFGPLRWFGIGAAIVMLAIALATYVVMLRFRRQYVKACREENIQPSWRRRT